ncbi:MAG: BatA domain-containing protein [Planctomycetota bacterium]
MSWLQPQVLWMAPLILLPLLFVLARWRRSRHVRWPAVRLVQGLQRRHRFRFWWQRWGLVVLRTLLLTMLILAWAGPRPRQRTVLGQRPPLACVLLVDDSASSQRGDAFAGMQARIDSYLAARRSEDEVSLLRGSRLDAVVRPRFDHQQLRREVGSWQASAGRSDLPALLEAGIEQLRHHVNDAVEIVLVSDAAGDGWGPATERVLDRLDRLRNERSARLFLLNVPSMPADAGNVALSDAWLSHDQIGAGARLRCGLRWQRWGRTADGYQVRLRLGDQVVAQVPLPQTGEQGELHLETSVLEPGQHMLTVQLQGPADAAAVDDRRYLPLTVLPEVPVMVVEGHDGAADALCAVMAADDTGWEVRRHHYAAWQGQGLQVPGILVLHAVPSLPPALVAGIERFLQQGGGVMVFPGPAADLEHWRGSWWREGGGFLPVAVEAVEPGGDLQAPVGTPAPYLGMLDHPAITALPAELFRSRPWHIEQLHHLTGAAQSAVLLRLQDGRPLCLQRQRGDGWVIVWAGVRADQRHPAYPLLMRGLLASVLGAPQPTRSHLVGDRLRVLPAAEADAVRTLHGPVGMLLPDPAGRGLISQVLTEPGGIALSDGREVLWYTVNVDPDECQPPRAPALQVRARFALTSGSEWSRRPPFWYDALRPLLVTLALLCLFLEWFLVRETPR